MIIIRRLARRIPLRMQHCPTCGGGVVLRDHHCVWIGRCVGTGNMVEFLLFITSATLVAILSSTQGVASLLHLAVMSLTSETSVGATSHRHPPSLAAIGLMFYRALVGAWGACVIFLDPTEISHFYLKFVSSSFSDSLVLPPRELTTLILSSSAPDTPLASASTSA